MVAKPYAGLPARRPPERPRRAPGSSRRHVWSQNLMWGLPRGAPWSAPGRAPQLLGRALERSRRRRAGGRAEGFATLRVWLPRGVFFVFTRFFVWVHSAFFYVFTRRFCWCSVGVFSVFTRRFLMFHSAFCRCSLGDFHVFTRRFSGVHSAICRCSLCVFWCSLAGREAASYWRNIAVVARCVAVRPAILRRRPRGAIDILFILLLAPCGSRVYLVSCPRCRF